MGVAWLLEYPLAEADWRVPGSELLARIERAVLAAARPHAHDLTVDTFHMQAMPYLPVKEAGSRSTVYVCQHSEYPASNFVVVHEGDGKRPVLATADRCFNGIMDKLNPPFSYRRLHHMETRGFSVRATDLYVRVGAVTIAGAFRGISFELEYSACSDVVQCEALLRESALRFLPPATVQAHLAALAGVSRPSAQCTPAELAGNYVELFGRLRQQQTAAGGAPTAADREPMDSVSGHSTPVPPVSAAPAAVR